MTSFFGLQNSKFGENSRFGPENRILPPKVAQCPHLLSLCIVVSIPLKITVKRNRSTVRENNVLCVAVKELK